MGSEGKGKVCNFSIDTSYDLSCIINDALTEVLGNDKAFRVIKFIENTSGRDIGELAIYDPKQLVELLELVLGPSLHKVSEEMLRIIINKTGCRPEDFTFPSSDSPTDLIKVFKEINECIRRKARMVRHSYMDIVAAIRDKARSKLDSGNSEGTD